MVGNDSFLTTREAGEALKKPEWLVRRIADKLPGGGVPRFGAKRMIPMERLKELWAAIQEWESTRRRSPGSGVNYEG